MITKSRNLIHCIENLPSDSQGKSRTGSHISISIFSVQRVSCRACWIPRGKQRPRWSDLSSWSHGCLFLHHLLRKIWCGPINWRKERFATCSILTATLAETSRRHLIFWHHHVKVKLLFQSHKNTGLSL